VKTSLAKEQRLSTITPTQISGACGRLMCCLRYEHEFYVAARKRFPKQGKIVQTLQGEEKVDATDIFRDLVTLRNPAGETRIIPLAQFKRELAGDATPVEEEPLDAADEGTEEGEERVVTTQLRRAAPASPREQRPSEPRRDSRSEPRSEPRGEPRREPRADPRAGARPSTRPDGRGDSRGPKSAEPRPDERAPRPETQRTEPPRTEPPRTEPPHNEPPREREPRPESPGTPQDASASDGEQRRGRRRRGRRGGRRHRGDGHNNGGGSNSNGGPDGGAPPSNPNS
ncbi:MAG: hypothetical protein Q8K55_04515, partial [Gemmatimonadaceae bacterium]|nr:hypothetical protein [Gemmatimonadaceae bacterium]